MTIAELPLFSFFKGNKNDSVNFLVGYSGRTPIVLARSVQTEFGFWTIGVDPRARRAIGMKPIPRHLVSLVFEAELKNLELLKYWGAELK